MKRSMTSALVAVMALGMAACDEQPTTPGQAGQVAVAMQGDDGGSASSSRSSAARFSTAGEASGTVEVVAQVWVRAETGQWVEVTRGPTRQTVQASGRDGLQVLASGRLETGSYDHVRVEFQRVETRGVVGLQIGSSLFNGTLQVNLGGDGKTTVEKRVELDVDAEATSQLAINLNSGDWMSSADSRTGAVAESRFQSAVQIFAR